MSAVLFLFALMAVGRLLHGPPEVRERPQRPTFRRRADVREPQGRAGSAAKADEDEDDELGLLDDREAAWRPAEADDDE